jgi:hypothetical protein
LYNFADCFEILGYEKSVQEKNKINITNSLKVGKH